MNERIVGWLSNPIYTDNIVKGVFDVFSTRHGMVDKFRSAKIPKESFNMCHDLSLSLKDETTKNLRSGRYSCRHHFENIPGESDSLICSSNRVAMSEFFVDEISSGRLNYENDLKTDRMRFIDGHNCVEWLRFFAVAGEWETHLLALTATAVNSSKEDFDRSLPRETAEFIYRMLLPTYQFLPFLDRLCDEEQRPALPDYLKSEIRKNMNLLREKLDNFMRNCRDMSAEESIVALKTVFVAVAGILSGVESFLFDGSSGSVNNDVTRIRNAIYKATGPEKIAIYAGTGRENL